MNDLDRWGAVAPSDAMPREMTDVERQELRRLLQQDLPGLSVLLGAATGAARGPDPESALVFLWMLSERIHRLRSF